MPDADGVQRIGSERAPGTRHRAPRVIAVLDVLDLPPTTRGRRNVVPPPVVPRRGGEQPPPTLPDAPRRHPHPVLHRAAGPWWQPSWTGPQRALVVGLVATWELAAFELVRWLATNPASAHPAALAVAAAVLVIGLVISPAPFVFGVANHRRPRRDRPSPPGRTAIVVLDHPRDRPAGPGDRGSLDPDTTASTVTLPAIVALQHDGEAIGADVWLCSERPGAAQRAWCWQRGVHVWTPSGDHRSGGPIDGRDQRDGRSEPDEQDELVSGFLARWAPRYDVVVFVAAGSDLEPGTLDQLLLPLSDPLVGRVEGTCHLDADADRSWAARGGVEQLAGWHGRPADLASGRTADRGGRAPVAVRVAALDHPVTSAVHRRQRGAARWTTAATELAVARCPGPASFVELVALARHRGAGRGRGRGLLGRLLVLLRSLTWPAALLSVPLACVLGPRWWALPVLGTTARAMAATAPLLALFTLGHRRDVIGPKWVQAVSWERLLHAAVGWPQRLLGAVGRPAPSARADGALPARLLWPHIAIVLVQLGAAVAGRDDALVVRGAALALAALQVVIVWAVGLLHVREAIVRHDTGPHDTTGPAGPICDPSVVGDAWRGARSTLCIAALLTVALVTSGTVLVLGVTIR